VLDEDRAFSSNEAPVLANGGLNMYWSTYKNEFLAWAGELNVKRSAFDQRATNLLRPGGLGDPRYISARAPPTLSSLNDTELMIYGPQADGFIFKANFDYSSFASYATDGNQPISCRLIVSPDNAVLYYASPVGNLVQVDADSMNPIYTSASTGQYVGEIAQSVDGAYIYAADTGGNIRAYLVADVVGGPTLEPLPGDGGIIGTFLPTPSETDAEPELTPSPLTTAPSAPSQGGTLKPSMMPTLAPSKLDVPNASPVGSSSALVPDEKGSGVSSDVLIAIIVSVAFVITVVLISLLILHIRKQRQLVPGSSNIPPGNEYSSGVAASVVSVSATPLYPRENNPIPEVRRKERKHLGGQRLPGYKDQCQPAVAAPDVVASDDDYIPVVSAKLDASQEATDREERDLPRGLDP
jgi:hypothetical protein